MKFGNLPIQILLEFEEFEKYVKDQNKLNILDVNTFKLDYKEQNKEDIINLINIMKNYTIHDQINIANKYDNIIENFLERYYSNKFFDNNNYKIILNNVNHIRNIVNYFLLKYKMHHNAPRPFQVANFYNEPLHPVNLLSSNTPTFPSGHSSLYYAYYLYFSKIDNNNNYNDILNNGRRSRIISGLHFIQDDCAAIKLVNEIFNNCNELKQYLQ